MGESMIITATIGPPTNIGQQINGNIPTGNLRPVRQGPAGQVR